MDRNNSSLLLKPFSSESYYTTHSQQFEGPCERSRGLARSRSPNRHLARVVLCRMLCSLLNLICSFSPIRLRSLPRMQPIPFIIRILELEFSCKVGQHQLDFRHYHPFSNAISGPVFKGSPCVLHGIQPPASARGGIGQDGRSI